MAEGPVEADGRGPQRDRRLDEDARLGLAQVEFRMDRQSNFHGYGQGPASMPYDDSAASQFNFGNYAPGAIANPQPHMITEYIRLVRTDTLTTSASIQLHTYAFKRSCPDDSWSCNEPA